ncbi:MAG: hypothetical protein IJA72_01550 [Clostridia bacterium]|nr:hypothetical protein [Clostridia bacterium]
MLYDANNARLLLGVLMINAQYLHVDKYILSKDDFEPIEFHLRLFQAIKNLSDHGAKSIDAYDIYELASNRSDIIDVFDANNLKDFCNTIKQLAKIDNIDFYYEEVRKHTILRSYKAAGFDISKFENNVKNTTIKDIVNYFDGVQIAIKKKFYKDNTIQEVKAGENFKTIKENFKKDPLYGASLWSDYLNTASRGWINGQLVLISMPSGTGKSTTGLANLVKVCCPQIYSEEDQAYIDNPCYQRYGGLYIEFEMQPETEVTPRLISTISNVPCYHILNGKYDDGEEERVDKAIDILNNSNIYIVVMPNFTDDLIESYTKDYVINHNVKYICFDYITDSSSASANIAQKNAVSTRSDQVLASISAKLKEIAVRYNVAVMTFTQVNASINSNDILDASVIAGSRAIQNVLDVGMIVNPLRKQEQEICDMMMDQIGIDKFDRPNRIIHLYKCRFGSEEQGIKIWINLNLSTGLVKDCFVTDKYNKPYNMVKTKLIYNK